MTKQQTTTAKFYGCGINFLTTQGILHDFAEDVTQKELYKHVTIKNAAPFSTTYEIIFTEKDTKNSITIYASLDEDEIGHYTELRGANQP